MKLIIDIPKETYEATSNGSMLPLVIKNVLNAVKNGKVLEEGCIDKWELHGKKAEAWIINGKLQIRNRGTIHNIDLPLITPQESSKGIDL